MKDLLLILLCTIPTYLLGQKFQVSVPVSKYSSDTYITINDGKEEYHWRNDKKKLSGIIKFDCGIDGSGGIYQGYEGKGRFIAGFRHGEWNFRNCDSRILYIVNYNNGLLIGNYKVYSEYYKPIKKDDGSLSNIKCDTVFYQTNFENGDGIWKDFYSNGDIKELGEYKSGKKEGEWLYYEKGNILYQKKDFEKGFLIRTEAVELTFGYRRELIE